MTQTYIYKLTSNCGKAIIGMALRMHFLQKLLQFTVFTILVYQFRKVHHFSVSHALHYNNHNTCLKLKHLPTIMMSYALLRMVRVLSPSPSPSV